MLGDGVLQEHFLYTHSRTESIWENTVGMLSKVLLCILWIREYLENTIAILSKVLLRGVLFRVTPD